LQQLQQPQQTGVPFMLMTHMQPDSIMVIMHSQQSWIILQHFMSPLVHMMHMPSLVISTMHMPIIMLQVIMVIPFIIIWKLTMPPLSIVQRFCIMDAAISSEAMHMIFIPSLHFSILNIQRGIIIMSIVPMGIPAGAMLDIPIMLRPIVIICFFIGISDFILFSFHLNGVD